MKVSMSVSKFDANTVQTANPSFLLIKDIGKMTVATVLSIVH